MSYILALYWIAPGADNLFGPLGHFTGQAGARVQKKQGFLKTGCCSLLFKSHTKFMDDMRSRHIIVA